MTFSLLPVEASTISAEVDHLLIFLLTVGAFFTVLIFAAIAYFAIRTGAAPTANCRVRSMVRRRSKSLWSVIPFGLTIVMFGWGASVFFREPPAGQLPSRWMSSPSSGCGSCEHRRGQAKSTSCTFRWGAPVRLTMTSEDVIHSFFVPAFRTKQDVVPGRYTTTWFQPTKVGQVPPPVRRILRYESLADERAGFT